jgi:hypothetical protein
MTAPSPIPFGVQVSQGESPHLRMELSENMYAESNPDGAKGPVALLSTPGLELFASVGDGPIRGMLKVGASLYVVSGQELYEVAQDGSSVYLTDIGDTGPVTMITNRPVDGSARQVAIGTTGLAYAGSPSGGFTSLPEQGLTKMAYQDGYGLAVQAGTENLFISARDDLTSWSALDFTTVDSFPDSVVSLISDHREVWAFGEDTTEVYTNSGNPTFPFERVAFIEHGCVAPASAAKMENTVFWLDQDGVYSAQGYQPQLISTPAVAWEISLESSPQTAQAFTYSQAGHRFYCLTFPGRTLCYDMTTGLWHKRKSYNVDRWRVSSHERIWRKNLVGDYVHGRIYEMKRDIYTENGDLHIRKTVSPPLYAGGERMLLDQLTIDCQKGFGLVDGTANEIILDWTDDYGHTWSNSFAVSIGEVGEYEQETKFTGLGSFFQRSFRLTYSGNGPLTLTGVYGRMEILSG